MTVLRRYCVGAVFGLSIWSLPSIVAALDVPSGQPITLHEVLVDTVNSESWLRFRFIAPRISRETGDMSYSVAAPDMEHLCTAVALPYIAEYGLSGDLIVVSLADQETEFGETNPDVTQFFDAFRVENDACIWEIL